MKAGSTVAAAVCLLLGTSGAALASCEPYFVESSNGKGGFRFMHDANNFRTIASGKRFDGKICDRDSIKVELAKMKPKTALKFHINGKAYEFEGGDKGDKQANNWYRKNFKISY